MSSPPPGACPPLPLEMLTSHYTTSSSSSTSGSAPLDCSTLRSSLPDPEQLPGVSTSVQLKVWGWLVPFMDTSPSIPVLELTREQERYSVGRDQRCDLTLEDWMFTEKDDNKQCNKASRIQFGLYLNSLDQPSLTDRSLNGTFVNKVLVGRDCCVRIHHLGQLSILQPDLVMFQYLDHATLLSKGFPVRITLKYLVADTIGSGTFSQVKKGFTKEGFHPVALKFIKKPRWWEGGWAVFKEVELLRSLRHPCITTLLDVEDGSFQLVAIMEYAAGGDLQAQVILDRTEGRLSEEKAKFQFYQVSHAIAYLHSVKVCHRDLKLANILLMEPDNPLSLIKVCDFGVSKKWSETTVLSTFVGTPNFVAPEVLSVANQLSGETMSYSCKSDCWSLGVVLYMLLAGELPFTQQLDKGQCLIRQIMTGTYKEMTGTPWEQVTSQAKDLVTRLLQVKPGLRLASSQILQHPWFSEDPETCILAREKMYDAEKDYTKRLKLQSYNEVSKERVVEGEGSREGSEEPDRKLISPLRVELERKEEANYRCRSRVGVSSTSSNLARGRGVKRKSGELKSVAFLVPGRKRRRHNSEVVFERPVVEQQNVEVRRSGRRRRNTGS